MSEPRVCPKCEGEGWLPDAEGLPTDCPDCDGDGVLDDEDEDDPDDE